MSHQREAISYVVVLVLQLNVVRVETTILQSNNWILFLKFDCKTLEMYC